MPRLLCTIVCLSAVGAAGCEPTPTSELLKVTFGTGEFAPPVEVDVNCNNGGCDGFEQLEATLNFEEGALTSGDAQVEILQYRVDYLDFGEDDADQPPYYASYTSVLVDIDTSVAFNVRAAGDVQRDWVRARFGTGQIDGTGSLWLQGYDHRNEIVEVEGVLFDISFGDFVTSGGDAR